MSRRRRRGAGLAPAPLAGGTRHAAAAAAAAQQAWHSRSSIPFEASEQRVPPWRRSRRRRGSRRGTCCGAGQRRGGGRQRRAVSSPTGNGAPQHAAMTPHAVAQQSNKLCSRTRYQRPNPLTRRSSRRATCPRPGCRCPAPGCSAHSCRQTAAVQSEALRGGEWHIKCGMGKDEQPKQRFLRTARQAACPVFPRAAAAAGRSTHLCEPPNEKRACTWFMAAYHVSK